MKLDIGPVRSTYVAPTFGGEDRTPLDPGLQKRLRQPMKIGAAIIGVFVLLGLWRRSIRARPASPRQAR